MLFRGHDLSSFFFFHLWYHWIWYLMVSSFFPAFPGLCHEDEGTGSPSTKAESSCVVLTLHLHVAIGRRGERQGRALLWQQILLWCVGIPTTLDYYQNLTGLRCHTAFAALRNSLKVATNTCSETLSPLSVRWSCQVWLSPPCCSSCHFQVTSTFPVALILPDSHPYIPQITLAFHLWNPSWHWLIYSLCSHSHSHRRRKAPELYFLGDILMLRISFGKHGEQTVGRLLQQ